MRLPALASRCAAVALLIVALAALQLLFGQPLIDSFAEHRQSIAQSQAMLTKFQHLNTSRPQMDAALARVKEAQQNEGRLLAGESIQLVGAQLQNRLKELVEANDGSLGSVQLLPVRQEEGFQRVSMAVTLKSTVESLQGILYEIENHSPYFFVEKLELRKERGFMTGEADDESTLQVRLEFYGYMTGEAQ